LIIFALARKSIYPEYGSWALTSKKLVSQGSKTSGVIRRAAYRL
jgi:hypothetical protein